MAKQPLSDRYNAEFFSQAEKRREKFASGSIRVGQKTGPDIDRILRLHYQAHQAYYFGHFETTATLCGVLLEQCLFTLLDEEIVLRGQITIKDYGQIVPIKNTAELKTLSLYKLTAAALYFGIIPRELQQPIVELRLIRNQLVHGGFPALTRSGNAWQAEIPANPHDGERMNLIVEIPCPEFGPKVLSEDAPEIWSCYILTRTRELMSEIFESRVRRLPPKDKAGIPRPV